MGLFGGVVDFQREDGESVDDEAGGLGVEGGGIVLRPGLSEQGEINFFDEIVALLVQPINLMFDVSHGGVGGVWVASLVLFVPEVEVGAVLREGQAGQLIGRLGIALAGVPLAG